MVTNGIEFRWEQPTFHAKTRERPQLNEINTEMITILLKHWLTNGLSPNMGFCARRIVKTISIKPAKQAATTTREIKIGRSMGCCE